MTFGLNSSLRISDIEANPFYKPFVSPFGAGLTGDFSNPIFGMNSFADLNLNNDFMSSNLFNFNTFMPMPLQFFKTNVNNKSGIADLESFYNQDLGKELAQSALDTANKMNSRHKCLKGVRITLNKMKLVEGTLGASAYMAADMLAKNNNFKEVSVSRDELKKLPAGCVIVWDKNEKGTTSADLHGHIAITLGDGKETSDHTSNRIYMLNSSHRVFVPVGINKNV